MSETSTTIATFNTLETELRKDFDALRDIQNGKYVLIKVRDGKIDRDEIQTFENTLLGVIGYAVYGFACLFTKGSTVATSKAATTVLTQDAAGIMKRGSFIATKIKEFNHPSDIGGLVKVAESVNNLIRTLVVDHICEVSSSAYTTLEQRYRHELAFHLKKTVNNFVHEIAQISKKPLQDRYEVLDRFEGKLKEIEERQKSIFAKYGQKVDISPAVYALERLKTKIEEDSKQILKYAEKIALKDKTLQSVPRNDPHAELVHKAINYLDYPFPGRALEINTLATKLKEPPLVKSNGELDLIQLQKVIENASEITLSPEEFYSAEKVDPQKKMEVVHGKIDSILEKEKIPLKTLYEQLKAYAVKEFAALDKMQFEKLLGVRMNLPNNPTEEQEQAQAAKEKVVLDELAEKRKALEKEIENKRNHINRDHDAKEVALVSEQVKLEKMKSLTQRESFFGNALDYVRHLVIPKEEETKPETIISLVSRAVSSIDYRQRDALKVRLQQMDRELTSELDRLKTRPLKERYNACKTLAPIIQEMNRLEHLLKNIPSLLERENPSIETSHQAFIKFRSEVQEEIKTKKREVEELQKNIALLEKNVKGPFADNNARMIECEKGVNDLEKLSSDAKQLQDMPEIKLPSLMGIQFLVDALRRDVEKSFQNEMDTVLYSLDSAKPKREARNQSDVRAFYEVLKQQEAKIDALIRFQKRLSAIPKPNEETDPSIQPLINRFHLLQKELIKTVKTQTVEKLNEIDLTIQANQNALDSGEINLKLHELTESLGKLLQERSTKLREVGKPNPDVEKVYQPQLKKLNDDLAVIGRSKDAFGNLAVTNPEARKLIQGKLEALRTKKKDLLTALTNLSKQETELNTVEKKGRVLLSLNNIKDFILGEEA